MNRKPRPLRSLAFTLGVAALVGGLLLAGGRAAFPSDIQLLRRGNANPFIFLLVDTSASMNLGLNDVWLPGGADNPSSRLYMAKQALAEVFGSLDDEDVNVGMAGFNQDLVRVVSKHWLYYNATALPAANDWPLGFPLADADGLTTLVDTLTVDSDGDGLADAKDGIPDTLLSDVEGDVLTFGPPFAVGANIPVQRQAGTCASPLNLDTTVGRRRAQTFAIDPSPANPSTLYLSKQNKTYLVTAKTDPAAQLGQDNFKVAFTAQELNSQCNAIGTAKNLTLNLRLDVYLNDHLVVDSTAGVETLAGLWDAVDVAHTTDYITERPHTGFGWEGNYDSNHDGSLATITGALNLDRYCSGATCVPYKPIRQTVLSSVGRVLDRGDLLPMDWNNTNLTELVRRMNPMPGDYGAAGYFEDSATGGLLLPLDLNRMPLLAAGLSPLNKSINDFRCYYLGKEGQGNNKCTNTAFYSTGWDTLACQQDRAYGCRRPYLIVITDGEENTRGSDATSEVGNMNSHAGVQTWVLNLGNENRCKGSGSLRSLTQAGEGQCVTVTDPTQLKTELLKILGVIEQRARSFASAAVPSVQVSVQDKVFVTNFVPLQSRSHWAGRVYSFLKPIPDEDADGRPDTDLTCTPSRDFQCLLWDAGAAILAQAPDAATAASGNLKLGTGEGERRVFYSRVPDPADSGTDTWPEARRFFTGTVDGTAEAIRYDLWRGFNIILADTPTDSLSASQESAHQIAANAYIARTLVKKSALVDDGSTIEFVLGDIFHSNPVVMGAPANVRYFAQNVNGYRAFAEKHQNRRKMLIFGANDGMFHAVEAGRYWTTGNDSITNRELVNEFDNGTGKELFAYVVRNAMPALEDMATEPIHQFTVDGSVNVADVFIDPKPDGGVATPSERLWRTVVVGGMREGGQSYYALDVNQPDIVNTVDGVSVPDYRGSYVPSCMTNYSAAACGPVPFPAALWEFTDSIYNSVQKRWIELDEDDNSVGDLGYTWSIPNLGRIRLCPDSECTTPEDRYVAVFGGGMEKNNKNDPGNAVEGNWLYMVDMETGQAIYKRRLIGAAPSEPSAVDTDQDGYLDRIYLGTLAGKLYRVDLVADSGGKYPTLEPQDVEDVDNTVYDDAVLRIPASWWQPKVIFDTNYDGSTALTAPSMARAIFYRPSVVFAAKLGLYALAFGTGDREDLWAAYNNVFPRFYVFVDETDNSLVSLPLKEGNFQSIDITSGNTAGADYLLAPDMTPGSRGWVLKFNEEDRLITDPFSLAGVTIFSTYRPRVLVTDGTSTNPETVVCSDKKEAADTNNTCAMRGNSRLFVMSTVNGNSFLRDLSGTTIRYRELNFFVTNPFAEQALTRNKTADNDANNDGIPDDQLSPQQQGIMDSLKSLFPKNCKFSNQRIDIKTITDETEIELIAPIPVCIMEKNWKEF